MLVSSGTWLLVSNKEDALYIYSKVTNSFYPLDMQRDYEAAGTWPNDGVYVALDEYQDIQKRLIDNTMELQPGEDGRPVVNLRRPPSAEEVSEFVRHKRNKLLEQSDWSQMPDAPVDRSAWATYRQALREVPQQPGFPFDVVWPEAPA